MLWIKNLCCLGAEYLDIYTKLQHRMSSTGYNTMGRVVCVKCRQRHNRVQAKRWNTDRNKSADAVIDLGTFQAGPSISGEICNQQGNSSAPQNKNTAKKQKRLSKSDVVDIKQQERQERHSHSEFSMLLEPSAHSLPKVPSHNCLTSNFPARPAPCNLPTMEIL